MKKAATRNSLIKKVLSMVMAASLVFSMMAIPALAADTDTPVHEDPVEPIGDQIGSCGGSITGSGDIPLYLTYGNSDAYVKAGTAATGASGTVTCSVTTPGGTTYNLGTIGANGHSTGYLHLSYASAGTYTFTFTCSNPNTVSVYGRIYD